MKVFNLPQVDAQMAMSDSREGKLLKRGELRYATTAGELCVMTSGMRMMLMWSAGSLGLLQ